MEVDNSDLIAPLDPDLIETSSLDALLSVVANVDWAAEIQSYLVRRNDLLFPFTWLHLTPPSDDPALPPQKQDNKVDFAKQNVREFRLGDTFLVRGWVYNPARDDGEGDFCPFLKLSYRGGPDSILSAASGHQLGAEIKLHLSLFDLSEQFTVPYNPSSHRYEVELWGCSTRALEGRLGPRARAAVERGGLQFRPNMIRGRYDAFRRDMVTGTRVWDIAEDHLLHPLRPLRVTYSWSDPDMRFWDSRGGTNYVAVFNSQIRGWEAFEATGTSPDTHGGTGLVRYTNLLSNYGPGRARMELGRSLEPWMFNAFSEKGGERRESFFAVDYVDMHVVEPGASFGIHRHRDNQEILFVFSGWGMLVSGDWCHFSDRQRAFQVQSLRQGHFAMVKSGGLHGFKNLSDERVQLLMFGGYD
jgi:hypothetical protein